MQRPRFYDNLLRLQLAAHRQMAFVAGPRQVGKTTSARSLANVYLDWDSPAHRRVISAGPEAVAEFASLARLRERPPILALDELHKFGAWKNWLKGFFDLHAEACRVIVTGSSRLDVYRRGGDSLMGRYFLYRMHPFSVRELIETAVPEQMLSPSQPLAEEDFDALWTHGGFPEPLEKRSPTFSRRWRQSRRDQLLREDVRDLTRVQELGQLEVLADLLEERSAEQITYSALAELVRVSQDTIRRWIETLVSLHFGFVIRPWFRNVTKSLRKEPKWYLRDWSGIEDSGKRAETFVACHLLKAVDAWNDMGLATCELRYLRDKEKREVDFLVVRDRKPWFLVEVKFADTHLETALGHFQEQTKAPHAFQVVVDLPYVAADCFQKFTPTVVPARTFLSHLV